MKRIKKISGRIIGGSGIPKEILARYPKSIMTDPDPEQKLIQEDCGQRSIVFIIMFELFGEKIVNLSVLLDFFDV